MFSLGGKQAAVAQTKSLSSYSKRTLLTSSNTSEQPSKKRKISSNNPDFTSIQTSVQVRSILKDKKYNLQINKLYYKNFTYNLIILGLYRIAKRILLWMKMTM